MKPSYHIKRLDWDSEFFGLRIGRATLDNHKGYEELWKNRKALQKKYDLLYVFCEFWQWNRMPEADRKAIYKKKIKTHHGCKNVSIYEHDTPNEELYQLALTSGEYSRFKLDTRLPDGSFERLYRRWMEQSCNGNMADKVFVYREKGHILGMLTLSIEENEAEIGLIAVDCMTQGMGIGSKMLHVAENYLMHETEVRQLVVPTQLENRQACLFYEKNKFRLDNVIYIYHWWLQEDCQCRRAGEGIEDTNHTK